MTETRIMPETPPSIKSLLEKSQDYLENRVELTKLKAVDKSSEMISSLTAIVLVSILLILFFLFVSMAAAMAVGAALGKMAYGFLIVGSFYGLLGLILFLGRDKWIKAPMANMLITKILK